MSALIHILYIYMIYAMFVCYLFLSFAATRTRSGIGSRGKDCRRRAAILVVSISFGGGGDKGSAARVVLCVGRPRGTRGCSEPWEEAATRAGRRVAAGQGDLETFLLLPPAGGTIRFAVSVSLSLCLTLSFFFFRFFFRYLLFMFFVFFSTCIDYLFIFILFPF